MKKAQVRKRQYGAKALTLAQVREAVRQEIASAVTFIERLDADLAWRSMDTAPSDGTRVLLLVTIRDSAPTVQVGSRLQDCRVQWALEGIGQYGGFIFHGWLPLPKVPEHFPRSYGEKLMCQQSAN